MDSSTFFETYSQIQQINKGGIGVIYLAFHKNLGKQVILKRLTTDQDESFLRHEVDILKNLRHRFLPTIYDFIQIEGSYFIVEDYIQGSDLSYYINNRIPVPEEYIVKWMKQMCEVLEYLHTRSPAVIHSDIKPGNIMIDTNGDICLIDFNISVLCGDRVSVIGFSNYYCAPEQLNKAKNPAVKVPIDARTDIYSTAATFYTLMTGRLPSAEKRNRPLSKMELPYQEGLLRLIDKAMSPKMSDRWQSARQMRSQFDHLERLTKKSRILTAVSAGLALVLAVSVAALIYGSRMNRRQQYTDAISAIESRYGREGPVADLADEIRTFVNRQENQTYLSKDNAKLAQLYAILAEYHIGQDTTSGYASAAEYYSLAWNAISDSDALESVKQEYAVNYAVALSLNGEIRKAEQFVSSFAWSNELVGVALRIGAAYQAADYEEVMSLAGTIPAGRDFPSLRSQLYKTVAIAAQMDSVHAEEDVALAVSLLEQEAQKLPSDNNYRFLSSYCLTAGNMTGNSSYYGKSSEYYTKIANKTEQDKLNQAETLAATRQYAQCISLAKSVVSHDQTELCRQNFILSLAYFGNGSNELAKNYWDRMTRYYLEIPARRRSQALDVNAIERLGNQLGVELPGE